MERDIIIDHALDKARQCRDKYVITNTSFLDMSERSAVDAALKKSGTRYVFFGGYDDAERTVCVFLPDYVDDIETFLAEHTSQTVRYVISAKLRWDVRDLLDQFNINERIIYPGLDGLTKWITRHYYVRDQKSGEGSNEYGHEI